MMICTSVKLDSVMNLIHGPGNYVGNFQTQPSYPKLQNKSSLSSFFLPSFSSVGQYDKIETTSSFYKDLVMFFRKFIFYYRDFSITFTITSTLECRSYSLHRFQAFRRKIETYFWCFTSSLLTIKFNNFKWGKIYGWNCYIIQAIWFVINITWLH